MNTKRFWQLLFATLLVVAAVFAFKILHDRGVAMESSRTYVGMGDLHRIEAAEALPKTGLIAHNQDYVGMGDLHRFEAVQALPKTGLIARNQDYVGMGDLHRYEFGQEGYFNK